ncbi:hypothetical protein L2D14_17220 [Thalassospiraceae bacterium LMO-JJ14]|nr:hypothetical protein L2D14_17220 [Thalassospiraceae bacterium LMO-JJ14]
MHRRSAGQKNADISGLKPASSPMLLPVLLIAILLSASACTQTAQLQGGGLSSTGNSGGAQPNASIFPDIPIPEGANMNVDKTLVVGTDNWFGQLALSAGQSPVVMFDFYRNRLPQFGWNEITSVRAPTSVLTYDREDRIMQMQITGSTLRGSEILITVSPRGTPRPSGGSAPVTRIN